MQLQTFGTDGTPGSITEMNNYVISSPFIRTRLPLAKVDTQYVVKIWDTKIQLIESFTSSPPTAS